MLKMDLEYKKNILFVRLKGHLNYKNTYKINTFLNPVVMKHKIKYLVYNLEDLESIDSSGVDAIIHSKRAIKSNQGKLVMCHTNYKIKNALRKLRLPSIDKENKIYKLIEA